MASLLQIHVEDFVVEFDNREDPNYNAIDTSE
jgi:hypothetical protein